MKKLIPFLILTFLLASISLNAQQDDESETWFEENVSIRKTFDGSKNEQKPASILFQENHKNANDFFNIDMAVKISQLDLWEEKLTFYPKFEWHKSTDTTSEKNKLDAGINLEYHPFKLKLPNLEAGLPNEGVMIAPWILGTSSFKRNFIDKVYESKLTGQLSFISKYKFLPGYHFRDASDNFRAIYYPYFGLEYYELPDLIVKDSTEKFSAYFFRIFLELWLLPEVVQLNVDATYRKILDNSLAIEDDIPIIILNINFYPGKQENFSIGYEYKNGYDTESKFQEVNSSSLKLNVKF